MSELKIKVSAVSCKYNGMGLDILDSKILSLTKNKQYDEKENNKKDILSTADDMII